MQPKITYRELHARFVYLSIEGLLINIKTGKIAGAKSNQDYLSVTINGKYYLVHRIAYYMYHGYWPENEIDHINQNPRDNRICNLREVSRTCNSMNSKTPCNNSVSGIKGVAWNNVRNYWTARIRYKKKVIHLGTFRNFINAVKARHYAEQKLDVHLCDYNSPAKEYLKNLEFFEDIPNVEITTNLENKNQEAKFNVDNEWKFNLRKINEKLNKINIV
jgi:hypothetical protein